jgi:hypothetical protein
MKKIVLITLLLLLSLAIFSQDIIKGDVKIILFDVSKSMIGYGDGQGVDIFDEVKEAAEFMINNFPENDYLMIYPYHKNITENIYEALISDETDKKKAVSFINELSANGLSTYLTDSYMDALKRIDNIKKRISDNSDVDVLILTDGKGNGSSDIDPSTGTFFLDNFIEKHKLVRSDYPFLLTKFVTFGEIFSTNQKNELKKDDIHVSEFNREEFLNLKIHISPDRILCNSRSQHFDLFVQFSDELEGEVIQLTEKTNQFDLDPPNIKLEKSKRKYSFKLIPNVQKGSSGKIKFTSSGNRKIIFTVGENYSKSNIIELEYTLKPYEVLLDTEKIEDLKNFGKLQLFFNEKQTEKIPTELKLLTISKDVNYNLKESKLKSGKRGLGIRIEPDEKKFFNKYRWTLDEDKMLPLELQIKSNDPYLVYKPEIVTINVLITKPFLKKILPFLIILGIIIIVLIIFLVLKKMFTAKFPKNAFLIIDGVRYTLKAKPFQKIIVAGNSVKSDINLENPFFAGEGKIVLKISKNIGKSIKLTSMAPAVEIKLLAFEGLSTIIEDNVEFSLKRNSDIINCKYEVR